MGGQKGRKRRWFGLRTFTVQVQSGLGKERETVCGQRLIVGPTFFGADHALARVV